MFERQPTEPLLFVFSVFAAWRLTAMLVYESGPFYSFQNARKVLVTLRMGRLVGCFHCSAVWLSAGVVLAVYDISWWSILLWLAVAGAVSIVERWLTGTISTESVDDAV